MENIGELKVFVEEERLKYLNEPIEVIPNYEVADNHIKFHSSGEEYAL